MKAAQLLAHFRALAPWLSDEDTVDKVIIGDPETEVSRAAVTWIAGLSAVREAVSRGCQLLITHEPTFWVHARELDTVAGWPADSEKRKTAEAKRRLIEGRGGLIEANCLASEQRRCRRSWGIRCEGILVRKATYGRTRAALGSTSVGMHSG